MQDSQEQKKPSGGAAQKIIAGVIMAAVALVLMWLNTMSTYVYDALFFIGAAAALYEMSRSLYKLGYKVIKTPLIIAVITLYPLAVPLGLGAAGFAVVLFGALIIAAISYVVNPNIAFKDFTATTFVLIYPFLFLSLGYLLNKAGGSFLLLFALLTALLTDTFAYFTGKIGNTIFKGKLKKLIPGVSPKKTVAGAVGGTVGCIAVMVLYWYLVESGSINLGYRLGDVITVKGGIEPLIYVIIALIASVVSQFGDLFASRIKRECGLKDFGNLIPGHGGIIDRIDAVMFAFAAVYAIIVIV
jgi:phosphatidate cytidylyltransferase